MLPHFKAFGTYLCIMRESCVPLVRHEDIRALLCVSSSSMGPSALAPDALQPWAYCVNP